MPRTPRTREQWRWGGGDREPSAGTTVRPQGDRNCCSLFLSCSKAQWGGKGDINSPTEQRHRSEKARGERETEAQGRAASGERQGKEPKELGDCALGRGSREGTPGVPAEPARGQRVLGRPGRAPGVPTTLRPQTPRWAGLRCAGTGRRREGSVRGSEAAAGNRTYVPSACWRRRCAGLASRETLGLSGASHRAARAGQGRAGPAGTARGVLRGRGLPESGGPRWSLLSVPRASQWRTVPSHAPAASPPRVAAGREAERGWGDWAPGLPRRGFPRNCLLGARSRPGRRRWRVKAEGPRRPGRLFFGKF